MSAPRDVFPHEYPMRELSWTFAAVLGAVAVAVAVLAVRGPLLAMGVLAGLAVLLVAAPFVGPLLRRLGGRTLPQKLALAAVWSALASTLVLRIRTASAIETNPIDSAASFRVATLLLAAALAGLCILFNTTRRWPRVPFFFGCYLAYVAVAAIGILMSVDTGLTAFRVVEIATFSLVFYATFGAFRHDLSAPIKNVMLFVYVLIGSAYVSLVVKPGLAWHEEYQSDRLKGVYPQISANMLGILATLCVSYGLGRRRIRWAPVIVGCVTVLAAQHRTGVTAVAAVVLVRLLLTRRRPAIAAATIVVALGLAVSTIGVADDIWARGQKASEVATLSARSDWWGAGIKAMGRSPVVGLGLTAGSRYEVFSTLRTGVADVPNLHSTWIEALVGAGIIGFLCLLSCFLAALWSSLRAAVWRLTSLPLMFLVGLGVNSVTHTTFEFGSPQLFLLLFSGGSALIALESRRRRPPAPDADATPEVSVS